MSEKSIIMSTPMIQAILDGRKTQTRRIVNTYSIEDVFIGLETNPIGISRITEKEKRLKGLWAIFEANGCIEDSCMVRAPYQPGDVLWVRETWGFMGPERLRTYLYKADDPEKTLYGWRSPIHMPRAAARIFLRVTDVRVERLQEISDKDALAEGFEGKVCNCPNARVWGDGANGCEDCYNTGWLEPPTVSFMQTWDELNKKRGFNWETNPWVWVISFERVKDVESKRS